MGIVMKNISSNTLPVRDELGSIEPGSPDPLEVMEEFRTLDKEAHDKADELVDEYRKVMRRFDEELLPIADRMQSLLSQRGFMHVTGMPSWTAWRDAFIKYLQKNMKMSLSTFKRKLKEYQDGTPLELGEGSSPVITDGDDNPPAPVVYESPKELLTKGLMGLHKLLTKGDEQGALMAVDTMQLALDDGLLNNTIPSSAKPEKRCLCNRFPTGVIEDDYVVIPLPRLAEILTDIADELYDGQHALDGFAEQLESIAFWLLEREELDRRMQTLSKRVAKRPEAARKSGLNWDSCSKELRRDRRNQDEMRILLAAGCKTYMGKPIKGSEKDPWVERFTRQQVEAEMSFDIKNMLGVKVTNEDYMPGMILEGKVPPIPKPDGPMDDAD